MRLTVNTIFAIFVTLTAGSSLCRAADSTVAAPEQRTAPFVGGEGGFAVYRIPALVIAKNGTVLAFAEGRLNVSDHAQNKIVLRRSADAGRTWMPLQVVADDGVNCLNNPTAAVLDSGRVLLMYQRYPADRHEARVTAGVSGNTTCLCFLTASDDNGATWSKPVDITPQVKRKTVATSIASGPGIGIELRSGPHAGRIIFPFNQGPPGKWQVYAAFSDDAGRSWHFGELAPVGDGRGNEVQMVELSDGKIMLNSRPSSGKRFRRVAVSDDAGQTWTPLKDDTALPDSQCQGSIVRYGDDEPSHKAALLMINPAVKSGRTHGTVRLSVDDGATWPVSKLLIPGDFAYSCLAVLPDKTILCLYEADGYSRIALIDFTMNWLREGQPATSLNTHP